MTFDQLAKKLAQPRTLDYGDVHPKLARNTVWCTRCGHSQKVDSSECLRSGWPRHCGATMTIDSPEERAAAREPEKKPRDRR